MESTVRCDGCGAPVDVWDAHDAGVDEGGEQLWACERCCPECSADTVDGVTGVLIAAARDAVIAGRSSQALDLLDAISARVAALTAEHARVVEAATR